MSSVNAPQDIKREKILDASYQRFLHYGYSKTTMNEIAGDLAMSKALLYYYFPDKSQLYVAVMNKLATDFINVLTEKVAASTDLLSAFKAQIDNHHNFMVTNYNFFDFFRLNEQNIPAEIWEIIGTIHQTEIELLSDALVKDVDAGKVTAVEVPVDMIDLILDALHGVKVRAMSHKKTGFPLKEHLDEIYQKRLTLIEIFVKGLGC
ncbi:TetR/AcrR family transcriptional regulator [Mucilaginibacter myungsuensis]|uniref:TetR/AcrR family transcriptional regulator n=1 Tax=Mucilaginibacter myungsuensis TaxID=649104 RepID=A0A929KX46_9SPHI|nr:TetR/AcrR family transcriptional regulator [Mucilaginibacter myungsuensis]MBE9660285.1 TetR/AcrR family transcriptional regulator [Mucilaginibacter myungsuensis]MDN3600327.1 TetR/AcrR family transcriptional regulator [Mucilaginibacter myungsuensis]